MGRIRVSSFNVENLFTRPRVLNLFDNARVADLLEKIARFKDLIEKKSYAGHEDEIVALYAELADFIVLNIRSVKDGINRLVLTRTKLYARGANDFVGFVDLKRANLSGQQIENTGRVIKAVKPDIQAFVEVEGRTALQRFDTDILDNMFADMIVVDGNDPRGIDVAMASVKTVPIEGVRTNVLAKDAEGTVFSRDCLEVEFTIGGRPLFVLVNHFKAKDRTPEKSDEKRRRQAAKVSEILTRRYDLSKDLVLVVGDFNDEPGSAPLKPLVSTPGLRNVFDVTGRPEDDRWTYYYGKEKAFNQIDLILVSDALSPLVRNAGIERRGIGGLARITGGAETSFDTVTNWRDAASDHAAVWTDLELS